MVLKSKNVFLTWKFVGTKQVYKIKLTALIMFILKITFDLFL